MALGSIFSNERNLPHYTSRKEAGIGKEEPIYSNLALVTIIPPPQLGSGDLLQAQLTSVSGISTAKVPAVFEQFYRGATRSFAGGKVDNTAFDITLNFNMNLNSSGQNYIWKQLRNWIYLIDNRITGTKGKKVDYVGQAIIEYHDRPGDIFRRVRLFDIFPNTELNALNDMDLIGDGSLKNIESFGFRVDYFEEEDA